MTRQELEELRFLAEHRQLRSLPQFTNETKMLVVKSYLLDHVPISQLSKEFGVSRISIWRWIRNFADGNDNFTPSHTNTKSKLQESMVKGDLSSKETLEEELRCLRAENKRLSEALKMSEWMNHAKDVMIDQAEKTFNIPIRKKSGAKQ